MPTARALRLCPDARVVPVPRDTCRLKSREVRRVLRRFSPVVEPASIDEAYIDMSGTEALYAGEHLSATARRMQAEVFADAGISVSIGGGTSRLIAKLAAGVAKPAGVAVVDPGWEIGFMRRFDLAEIPGIGPVFTRELQRFGLVTVAQALEIEAATLERWLGRSRAAWLLRRIRGIDSGLVEPGREARSMSREETFARDLNDRDVLETELLALAVRLGADLRREGLRARTVTVKIRDADFRTRTASRTLDAAVESDRALFALAVELLQRLRTARPADTRLLGIAVSHLEAGGDAQLAMFEEAGIESERDRRLSRTADTARERFGSRALRPGRLLERSIRPPPGDGSTS